MRYKRVKISGHFLTRIMQNGILPKVYITGGLPEDARFAYSIPNQHYGIEIVIEHESFPDLKDGDLIPELKAPLITLY